MLDVRPPFEADKAGVAGAVRVPLYVPESFDTLPALLKHGAWLGMGGLWLGGLHMKPNPRFADDVSAAVPRTARVVVACQKGLRSLAAAEQLARAGYGDLAWVNGGLDTAAKTDLEVVGATDLRCAENGAGSAVEAAPLALSSPRDPLSLSTATAALAACPRK
jgi:rhodanese-related sulfurtransferase